MSVTTTKKVFRRSPNGVPTTVISVELPMDLLAQIKAQAAREDRSQSSAIRQACRGWLSFHGADRD